MAPNTVAHLNSLADTADTDVQLSFSHVHLYVDYVEDVAVYKTLEDKLNSGNASFGAGAPFVPQNRDVVKQLMAGFGFRITGARMSCGATNTRSVLVTSKDPKGVQFVVTAMDPNSVVKQDEICHFDASEYSILS